MRGRCDEPYPLRAPAPSTVVEVIATPPPPPPPYSWSTRDVVVQSLGTNRQWWLKASVDQINATRVVRLRFGTCDGTVQCISVSSSRSLAHLYSVPAVGVTAVTLRPDSRKIANAAITMDDTWGQTLNYTERRATLTHELLHALGMSHDTNPASVLTPVVGDGAINLGRWDARKLERIYRYVG